MTDLLTLANIGRAVLAIVLLSVGYWAGGGTSDEAPADSMRVELVQGTMEVGDVAQATEPEVVKVYEAPDSQDSRQDCIKVPSWLDSLTYRRSENAIRRTTDTPNTPAHITKDSTASRRLTQQLAGLPYVITPTTNGRPSLSVDSEQATLSAIDPRHGGGLEYTVPVPQPTWSADWASTATAGLDAATLTSALYATRHSDWGELGIGPAGQAVVTGQGYSAGAALSIRLETTLYSR